MTLQQNAYTDKTNINPDQLTQDARHTHTQANAKPKTTLERLKQQQSVLAHRIHKAESRQRENERKQETRRKILVGAYYLEEARKTGTMVELNQKMANFLIRDSDKVLFGLPDNKGNDQNK